MSMDEVKNMQTRGMQQDSAIQNYIQALNHYGVNISKESLHKYILQDGTLSEKAYSNFSEHSEYSELIENLFSKLSKECTNQVDNKNFMSLVKLHQQVFEAYKDLWTEMLFAYKSNRSFTSVELEFYSKCIVQVQKNLNLALDKFDKNIADKAQAVWDSYTLDAYGLLFDEDMLYDISQLVSNVVSAQPSLIVGDKGIAKTQVAKFVMSLYTDELFILSVKGDMMSDEFIGKVQHDPEKNTFVFKDGILLRAMQEGKPLLLDEVNFGDQAIIARMQDLLLRRPNERVFIQEKGEFVTIQPGFAVFATANEASSRYRHREVLDPALRDRFDIIFRHYPDILEGSFLSKSVSLTRLAHAAACDLQGNISEHIDQKYLQQLIALAHATQFLYSNSGKDVVAVFDEHNMKTQIKNDSEPLMSDCITPRSLYRIVLQASRGNLPGKKLTENLITTILKNLDQANSHKNFEIAQQVQVLLG